MTTQKQQLSEAQESLRDATDERDAFRLIVGHKLKPVATFKLPTHDGCAWPGVRVDYFAPERADGGKVLITWGADSGVQACSAVHFDTMARDACTYVREIASKMAKLQREALEPTLGGTQG